MSRVTAHAFVRVTIELGGNGPYGDEWTVEAIQKDAKRAAEITLNELVVSSRHRINRTEEPEIVSISLREST